MTYITRLNALLASLTEGHRTGLDPDPPSTALVRSLDFGLKSVLTEIVETVEDAIGDVAGAGGGDGQSLVDLGIVHSVDLLDGPQILYTPAVGELVEIFVSNEDFEVFLPDSFIMDMHVAQNTGLAAELVPCGVVVKVAPSNGETPTIPSSVPGVNLTPRYVSGSTDPFVAYLVTGGGNALNVYAALPAWQASHAYADLAVILGPDGHVWVAPAGGTSGSSIPDFAGNESFVGTTWAANHVYGNGDLINGNGYIWSGSGGTSEDQFHPPAFDLPGPISDNEITWTYVAPVGSGVVTDNDITWDDEGAIPAQGAAHFYARVTT